MDGIDDWLRIEKTRMECRHQSNAGKGKRNWLEGYIAALDEVQNVLDNDRGSGQELRLSMALQKVRELITQYPELRESLDE